jgi:signal transduction histidine kinase
METNLPVARGHSLSTRLLALILLFVSLGGLLIHVPSVIRFWHDYLEHQVTDAYMATVVLKSAPAFRALNSNLERLLLKQVGVRGIAIHGPHGAPLLSLGDTSKGDMTLDLRTQTTITRAQQALSTMLLGGDRLLRVHGRVAQSAESVTVLIEEKPLRTAMIGFTLEVLAISVLISLSTATLVYLVLRWLIIRPVYRITQNLMAFRAAPDDPARIITSKTRYDEIGVMEREFARMQTKLRTALAQQSRLAALGTAVSKINHDLKSTLSTVSIASERLARVDDPTVRKIAPLLVDSVTRAVHMCSQTQDLARGDQVVPQRTRLKPYDLVDEVIRALRPNSSQKIIWTNEVPDQLTVSADQERLYRVVLNLCRNALEALQDFTSGGEIRISAFRDSRESSVIIDVADNGPGIPEAIKGCLFKPFVGTAKPGGTGLGLATSRDLVRAHGGDLVLLATGPNGTCFRITLPEFC